MRGTVLRPCHPWRSKKVTEGQLLTLAGGAIAALTTVIGVLWRLHLQEDERGRKRESDLEARLATALTAMKDNADVSDRAVALAEGAVNALRERGR
jgi:hypothetical protein